jgi:hypothetical protein
MPLIPAGIAAVVAIYDANTMLQAISAYHSTNIHLGGYLGVGPSVVVIGAALAVVGSLIPNRAGGPVQTTQ